MNRKERKKIEEINKIYEGFSVYAQRVLKYLYSQDREWLVDSVMEGCGVIVNTTAYLDKLGLTNDFVAGLDDNSRLEFLDLSRLTQHIQGMMREVEE